MVKFLEFMQFFVQLCIIIFHPLIRDWNAKIFFCFAFDFNAAIIMLKMCYSSLFDIIMSLACFGQCGFQLKYLPLKYLQSFYAYCGTFSSCTCYNNIRSVRTSVLSFYIHIYIQIIWVCINLYPPNTCNLFNQKTMFFSSKSDQMKWYECISNSGFNVNCDSHTCTSTNQHSAYILLHSTHVWCMYAYTLYSTRLMVLI